MSSVNSPILLATLNARYIHSAFGLRYLKANLRELESRARICEFTLQQRPLDIAEQLLAMKPRIIGLGVYVWNAEQSHQLLALLKRLAPEVTVVLGGPEVSYEQDAQPICQLADHVISGPGEAAFYALCRAILDGQAPEVAAIEPLPPEALQLPYYLYTDEDIQNRVVYVEASRGCPFRCEFCLSALDKTARAFPTQAFLTEMRLLFQRGARHFKFVDRTFNLNLKVSQAILRFFLDLSAKANSEDSIFLHFEVIPDRLPDKLKTDIMRFPAGSLQFEVGVQTFNPKVQALIQRRQDNAATARNLDWLATQSPVHVHSDLIFGLPGETLESMAASFDRLVALGPHEIQLGILKRLRGMPLLRHVHAYELVFSPYPPYEVLSTRDVDFPTMQRLRRMARYWDLVANSGRFRNSMPLLLGNAPFERFMRFSDWLFGETGQTHRISLRRMFDLVYQAMIQLFGIDERTVRDSLLNDFERSGEKGLPGFMDGAREATQRKSGRGNRRQQSHQAGTARGSNQKKTAV